MRTATRCIALAIGFFAGVVGRAQPVRIDTFVLHFAFDHSDIRTVDTGAFRLFIRAQLGQAGDRAGVDSIAVTGYTDTIGTPEYNQRLSVCRAFSAAGFFRQWLGRDSGLITRIEGHGESDALPGDDSESRRVVILSWHHPLPQPAIVQRDTLKDASEPDTVFGLDDIRFFANTTVLTDAAQLALPKYINFLLTLQDRYLEIDGYCNSPGPPLPPTDPLYILSVKRAKFIYDCLLEKGFSPDKAIYKGKGNTNPRNAHPTTRGEMDQNMRVEIRVFRKKPD